MKILLAHLKKPPGETRICDKLGASLSQIQDWDVTILGNDIPGIETKTPGKPYLIPSFKSTVEKSFIFNDLITFYQILKDKRPDLIVVCSPDLLMVAIFYKWINKSKIVFDMQENFPLNFSKQKHYKFFGFLLGSFAKIYLWLCWPFIDSVWFAEKIYQNQTKQTGFKTRTFENKVPVSWILHESTLKPSQTDFERPYLLFSGFITRTSGVCKAVHFFEKFQKWNPDWMFIVAGYCPDSELRQELREFSKRNPDIQLIGITNWLSGKEIYQHLYHSHAVLMPYEETVANLGKVPTKLFEAAFLGKPVLVKEGSQFLKALDSGATMFEVSFDQPKKEKLLFLASELKRLFQMESKKKQQVVFDGKGIVGDVNRLMASV
jgi:glycogen(starch) synthase